jgi:hypothetical protein
MLGNVLENWVTGLWVNVGQAEVGEVWSIRDKRSVEWRGWLHRLEMLNPEFTFRSKILACGKVSTPARCIC